MPSSNRVRLPNKTQWALDDLGAAQIEARRIMGEILNWTAHQRTEAGLNMDKARMANIGKLDHHIAALALLLAEMERVVSDAKQGIHRQELDGE